MYYFTKSAHQVPITRTHSYTRFVGLVIGLVIGLVTGLSNTIEHYRPMRADIAWEELRLERESLSAPAHALHVSVREPLASKQASKRHVHSK